MTARSHNDHNPAATLSAPFCDMNSERSTTTDDLAVLNAIRMETQRSGWKYCKCAKVIATVAQWQGNYDSELQDALVDETDWENEVLDRIYQRIIRLAETRQLVVGQGNFGITGFGPAHPKLTECSLTAQGLQLLERGDI